MEYYTMKHCGSLKEALKTIKKINKDEFNYLLLLYEYYDFDERINCHRFILRDVNDERFYTLWLLIGKIEKN